MQIIKGFARWRLFKFARPAMLVVVSLFLFANVLCPAVRVMALEVPAYQGYVNDYANIISPAMESKLNNALRSFDLSDSTQVAILTIPTLDGDDLADFSIRTAAKWKIGQKNKDNGVLLLVAQKERKIRIEVGRGLEPVLTDLLSGRIVDNIISPYFKQGRFDDGFAAGAGAIIKATRGEFKGDAIAYGRGASHFGRQRRAEPSPLFKFLFFGLALTAFLGSNSRKLGLLAGGVLFPLAFIFGLLPVGALFLLILIPVGAFGGWLLPLFLAGMFRGGGYYGGMGGFGGGGMGGGGFSGFGGGGFGGGGASGGW